ncbi:HAD family hydrolase [Vibrio sp. 10N.286.49.C2]|uniref:HAD family hydrolase n=1 Tax=unclassified Vibrio TaxID=2614977 RepID=UPI000C8226B5|nr:MULTISPECIES: HAD family hydrolase [unclassified Vibrio]PMH35126.1 HAD family hydrolase [Vibrio sp. 10N.286.49.C2]PMH50910.1 HAD family hydrolase [Vibrio sp. 10N.286.49.B1]PMH83572.1 HAD family hydrolase [Vibrio sp. 10N.286.48.B7]
MPINDIKFIASDMDGTLLNEHGQLDPTFFELHRQMSEKGIIFCAASGRQYYSLLETFLPAQDDMMFIAENGTLVMHKGVELYSCTIDKAAIHHIITEARKIPNTHVVLCGKQSAYIETQDEKALEEIAKYYHRRQSVTDLLNIDDTFIKVAICHFDGSEEHVYPSIQSQFGHSHQVVVSAKIWLDVMNAEASKGTAIQHLQNTLGFTHEQTMSFGDYFNDVEMLQASYHSYAVENAHEKVKTYARFSAPSNSEQGVHTVISEYLATLS